MKLALSNPSESWTCFRQLRQRVQWFERVGSGKCVTTASGVSDNFVELTLFLFMFLCFRCSCFFRTQCCALLLVCIADGHVLEHLSFASAVVVLAVAHCFFSSFASLAAFGFVVIASRYPRSHLRCHRFLFVGLRCSCRF